MNLGSYNYLGFAENTGRCVDDVDNTMRTLGNSTCSTRLEMGTTVVHRELERYVYILNKLLFFLYY